MAPKPDNEEETSVIGTMVNRGARALRTAGVAATLAGSLLLGSTIADAQTLGTPGVIGDQLLYIYDARTDRVAFLNISNVSDETIFLNVALYNAELTQQLVGEVVALNGAANTVIDPMSFGNGAADGSAGLAVITPVMSLENLTPVVPPHPLVGGFTLANLSLMSGFGQNPFARFAVNAFGVRQAPGTVVDGASVVYERFDPGILTIPAYFNPSTLAPPENDGNRVLLAAFSDDYDGAYGLSPVSTTASVTFLNNVGQRIVNQNAVPVNGVLLSNLQEISGGANIDGASGKVFLEVASNGGNVFGVFSQSLNTFAAGQRMPRANVVPMGGDQPVPTPTPTPGGGTPTPVNTPVQPPTGCNVTIALDFDDSSIPDLSGVVVIVNYPATAEIPGTGPDASEVITDLTGSNGLLNASDQDANPSSAFVTVGVVAIPGPISAGDYARINFVGSCSAADVSCRVDQASGITGNDVSGEINCTLSVG